MESEVLWARWGEQTRFLLSAQVAFARERANWELLHTNQHSDVRIKTTVGRVSYGVRLDQHLAAVSDVGTLYAAVLITSYALAEAAVLEHLSISQRPSKIEDWGTRLLDGAGRSWAEVPGGLAGAVEVAVVRNLLAHGSSVVDSRSAARLAESGLTARPEGSALFLTYETTAEFRARLKALLTLGGLVA